MKTRGGPVLVLLGILIAIFAAAASHQRVQAKDCFDAQNKPIPCPQYKNPTQAAPPTPISTETPTPTLTPTPFSVPTAPLPPAPAAPPPPAGGFSCPPYAGGVPLGIGILGAGLLLPALTRWAGTGSNPLRYTGGDMRPGAMDITQTAVPMGPSPLGKRVDLTRLAHWFDRFGMRQTSLPGLPDMNQTVGSAPAFTRLLGVGFSGLGAGVLASALAGGLAGLACSSAPMVVATSGLLGAVGAMILSPLIQLVGQRAGSMGEGTPSTFERIGSIQTDGSVTSQSGLSRNKSLE